MAARMTRTYREVFLFACSAAPSPCQVDRIARNVRIVRLLLSFHFNNLSSVDHESSKPLMPVIVRSESNLHCCTAASIRFVWPMRKDDTHTSRRVTNCIASARHATATIRWTAASYTANTNCTIALLLQSACFVSI